MAEDDLWTTRLESLQSSNRGIRLRRNISGADTLHGFVIDVGAEWLLMAKVPESRIDGFVAVRLMDIATVETGPPGDFYARVAQQAGTWPPPSPDTAIDLATSEGLVRSAAQHATMVNVQLEEELPDEAFIGVVQECTAGVLQLQEVSTAGTWTGLVSSWLLSDLTRLEFGGQYERDLLSVAGLAGPTG